MSYTTTTKNNKNTKNIFNNLLRNRLTFLLQISYVFSFISLVNFQRIEPHFLLSRVLTVSRHETSSSNQ